MRTVVGVLFLAAAVLAQQTPPDEDAHREALVRRLMKSAVVVHATHKEVRHSAKGLVITQRLHITLSGFLLDGDGHIVTVGHVVKDAESVEVEKPDGTRVKAEVVGVDPWTNVGLLKIEETEGLQPVEGGGKTAVGRRIVAVSSPLGLKNTVAFGYIAGQKRTLFSRQGGVNRVYSGMLQLSVPPALVDAGGLVADYRGRLVGMVASAYLRPPTVEHLERLLRVLALRIDSFAKATEKVLKDEKLQESLKRLREAARRFLFPERFLEAFSSVGVTFAVPENQIREAVRRVLKSGGRKPWLGVQVQDLTEAERKQLRLEGGVKVVDVVPESPAHKAGVRKFDVLVAMEGEATTDLEKLSRIMMRYQPGQTITLTVFRQGQKIDLKVTLGSR